MDPELLLKAIEGYKDELTPAHQAQEAFYRQFACPSCGCATMNKEFLSSAGAGRGVTFVEGEVMPRAMLRCAQCELLLNPHTGFIIENGEGLILPDEIFPRMNHR